jgi:uncharacterized protein YjiS (DUF1127 family)
MINQVLKFLGLSDEQVRYRKIVKELSALSDRELSDIGVSRNEIYSIAMGTYK